MSWWAALFDAVASGASAGESAGAEASTGPWPAGRKIGVVVVLSAIPGMGVVDGWSALIVEKIIGKVEFMVVAGWTVGPSTRRA